jgi:hypothetical protein
MDLRKATIVGVAGGLAAALLAGQACGEIGTEKRGT